MSNGSHVEAGGGERAAKPLAVGAAAMAVVGVCFIAPQLVRAQGSFPGAEEVAELMARQSTPRWKGPVVEPPREWPRPGTAHLALRSTFRPLSVHAQPDVEADAVAAALEALEATEALLDATGWPRPFPDGGRGRTVGFDLYLVRHRGPAADARADEAVSWAPLDAVSSYAIVDPDVPAQDLPSCVASAYAQAALLGQDPAEAPQWRRATGAYLAWLVTGRFGCGDAVATQQREPWRSWIRNGAEQGAGGALMLAALSARHDGGSGTFVRELWQLARQKSRTTDELWASPDLWMALERVLDVAELELRAEMIELAADRWFAGPQRRQGGTPLLVLRSVRPHGRIPVDWHLRWERLPTHTPPAQPALEPFGSAYALVDVSRAPPGSQLRVWLRGEYGVKWSLGAVRLDDAGRELARVHAPVREAPREAGRAYVPIDRLESTERVLLVVTNLSSRLPDADIPDENVRSFKLIVDRGGPAAVAGER